MRCSMRMRLGLATDEAPFQSNNLTRKAGESHSAGTPTVRGVGSAAWPDSDKPVTNETVERWLRDGLASAGSFGLEHVIHYHGREEELTSQQWCERYGPPVE